MAVVIDVCEQQNGSTTKNTGASKQFLEGATVGYALAKKGFSFDSLDALKTKIAWDIAKKNKDIVPFYSIEANLENSNTEPTFYESRKLKLETKKARKGKKFTHHLGICSHSSLKSYEDSGYTQVFEFTEDGYVKAVLLDGGKVKGQDLENFIVGIRKDATLDAPASTDVEFIYSNYKEFEDSGVISEPDFDLEDYEGIYEVALKVVGTPTATQIVVKATAGCSSCNGISVEGIALADFVFKKDDGTIQTIDSITSNGNEYTLVGASFVSGILSTAVIEQTNIMFESTGVKVVI